MKKILKTTLLFLSVNLIGCTTLEPSTDETTILKGPPITHNETPYTSSLKCAADLVAKNSESFSRRYRIAVDQIPDLTGKMNTTEGTKITQGVEYMAITALHKFTKTVQTIERRSIHIYNIENDLAGKQLIGDGKNYTLSNGQSINFRPLLKGSVDGADYFIAGAITEVNYNLYSGGGLFGISGFNFGKRKVAMNVAIDLRIINMDNLQVEDSITLQKQFIGERTKGDAFRFFDKELLSLDGGYSRDEPIQRGVRSLIEQGVSALVGKIMRVETDSCFQQQKNV
jgi:curli production assembly/transport component CsgG/holdfast attachment protein HfaB